MTKITKWEEVTKSSHQSQEATILENASEVAWILSSSGIFSTYSF